MIDRRQLLRGGMVAAGAAALPAPLLAASRAPADWTLGLTDVLGDIAPQALTRLHGRAPELTRHALSQWPAVFGAGEQRRALVRWRRPVRAWRIEGKCEPRRSLRNSSGGSEEGRSCSRVRHAFAPRQRAGRAR